MTDPAGPFLSLIDKDYPEYGWRNFLKKYSDAVIVPVEVDTGWNINIPYLGKKKIINKLPDQQQASSIVSGVLENVRVAFIEKKPDKLSRELGKVISTDESVVLRTDTLKNELEKLFAPEVAGGSVGAVQEFKELQIINVRKTNKSKSFSATIGGSANIAAKHWGHVDQRQINFQVLLDLVEDDSQWRLADLTVIDIKEVK